MSGKMEDETANKDEELGAVGGADNGDAASEVSHASVASNESVKSRIQVMIILEEHKKAKLNAKMAALRMKRELERQQQELKWKEEQLLLETEMEVQRAQSEVLRKFESEFGETSVSSVAAPQFPVSSNPPAPVPPPVAPAAAAAGASSVALAPMVPGAASGTRPADPSSAPVLCATTAEQLQQPQVPGVMRELSSAVLSSAPVPQLEVRPEAPVFQPAAPVQPQQTAVTEVLAALSQILTDQTRRSQLPALEPRVFKGDVEEFSLWIKSFECYIEARTTSSAERLHFLTQYTAGEARRSIQGLLHLRTEDAYIRAKNLLTDRYGNDFITANTYKKRLREWPAVRGGDGKALRQLADFLQHLLAASEEIGGLQTLNEPSEMSHVLKKLPRYVVDRWKRVVDTRIYEPAPGQESGYPGFIEFVNFMTKEARVACGPVTMQEEALFTEKQTPPRKMGPDRARVLLAATTDSKEPMCVICGRVHRIIECDTFNKMALAEKNMAVRKHGLCKGCLLPGHIWRSCRKKLKCERCSRWHPTALHDDSFSAARQTPEAARAPLQSGETQVKAVTLQVTANDNEPNCSHSMIVPVRIEHAEHPDRQEVVYALLDPQSDACFIKQTVASRIQAEGEEVLLELSTMAGETTIKTASMKNLIVRPIDSDTELKMPPMYSRQDIPAERHLIPRVETVRKWPHLKSVSQQLPPYFPGAEVGLLIGMNCPRGIKPRDVVLGDDEDPWAVKTDLGWSVVGPVHGEATEGTACRFISAGAKTRGLCHFAFRVHAQEVNIKQITRMMDADFQEPETDKKMSHEDHQFLAMMKDMRQGANGHFEAPLPLKNPDFEFPNNKVMAEKRLTGLKKRLNRDPIFKHDYESFMNDMLKKGIAEPVPQDELLLQDGKIWYVAHHGVYHPRKKKLRVVFDCSGEFNGLSLNSQLLQGPDHSNNLTGVLVRFRKQPVVVGCDIEGMFNQVGVDVAHRNLLRFLWWRDGNLSAEPTEYRMTTHLFGASSSPACAMHALSATADKYEEVYGEEASNFIRKNFYVDDGLISVPDTDTAVRLVRNTSAMCREGGFRLHKFVSNDPNVMKEIPTEDRSKNLQNVELGKEKHPLFEQALGILWNPSDDTLHFTVDLPKKPPTRRGILSMVSSLYDPLGLLSPFTLKGKCILKRLCSEGASWDDPVSEEVAEEWEAWKSDTERLPEISVPRCYVPKDFGEAHTFELHHFSDASVDGCAQCSYLRVIDDTGIVSSQLVMSRTKVTPKRAMTVPRLELTAAVMSTKTSRFLKNELDIENLKEYFWTDSKVVLGYVHNEAKRFHVFVANRIQQVRENSSPQQWRFVKSEENPADLASRGLKVEELKDNVLWWTGPQFLRGAADLPDEEEEVIPEVDEEDAEVRKTRTVLATQTNTHHPEFVGLPERLERFSSWFRAKKSVAICRRYMNLLQRRVKTRLHARTSQDSEKTDASLAEVPITAAEMKEAERVIIKAVQNGAFEQEFKTATDRGVPGKRSDLYRLDPILGEDGLLRVGGRLRRGDLSTEVTHPVILPKRGHVTDLIVAHFHQRTEHGGRDMTLAEIRLSGFWIVRGRMAASRHILRCVKCKRLRGTLLTQKMADLPPERLEPTEPFCFTGVDYFGPFYIRERRSEVKRWGVLFTCLNSRAIHIETANSLTTDAFLNAYRRFVCRRGAVKRLYCDNGTNFVGGRRELETALKEMNVDKLRRELLKDECDLVEFKMNPPHASHMGGSWERQIRSARAVLTSLLDAYGQQLDDELLRTLMTEAESIVNSRPLSYCSMTNTNAVEPITPSQLLTLKSKVVLSLPGRFCDQDVYARQRWRRVQHLASLFWTRWRREVLPTLQERQKWTGAERNIQPGDVVLLSQTNAPRNCWPLARVVGTYPSADGLVRSVRVQLADGSQLDRPVHCLLLLVRQT